MKTRKAVVVLPGTVVVSLALALGASPAMGAGLGDSTQAQMCKDGGWMSELQANGLPFNNQGACVSYVVQGGVFATGGGTAHKP